MKTWHWVLLVIVVIAVVIPTGIYITWKKKMKEQDQDMAKYIKDMAEKEKSMVSDAASRRAAQEADFNKKVNDLTKSRR